MQSSQSSSLQSFALCYHVALSQCSACLLQKLASVSPDLPRLVELLTVQQPKENEILLLDGLEASDPCQTHLHHPQVSMHMKTKVSAKIIGLSLNY